MLRYTSEVFVTYLSLSTLSNHFHWGYQVIFSPFIGRREFPTHDHIMFVLIYKLAIINFEIIKKPNKMKF